MSTPFSCKLSLSKTDYDSSGIDLGVVNKFNPDKSSDLDPFDYPDTDAHDQEYYDDQGAGMKITITGTYVANDWAAMLNWMEQIYALQNGSIYDDSQNIYLAVYIPNYYSSGVHLWALRDQMPYLDADGTIHTPVPQSSSSNAPICITISEFNPGLSGGTSPSADWTLTCVQRLEML